MSNKIQIISDFFTNISFEFSFFGLTFAAFAFAILGNLFSNTVLKNIKGQDIIGINFLIITGAMLSFSPFFFKYNFNEEAIIYFLWVVVLDMSANYFYFKIFEKLKKSIHSIIISLVTTLIFFLGWLFWDDLLSWQFLLLSILLMLIITSLTISFKNFKKIIVLLLFTLFFYFCSSLPSQIILTFYGIINAPTLYMIRAGAIGLLGILYKGNLQKLTIKQYKLIFVRGILIIGQWVTMYTALIQASKINKKLNINWIIGIGFLLLLNLIFVKYLEKRK